MLNSHECSEISIHIKWGGSICILKITLNIYL